MNCREKLVEIAKTKPVFPYTLDEELTFFCPQENAEALHNPKILELHDEVKNSFVPDVVKGRTTLIILPCTKIKPYSLSNEHLTVNSFLWSKGFRPTGKGDCPEELKKIIPAGYPDEILNNSVWSDGSRCINRMVMSEPMGLVPYEFIYYFKGRLSLTGTYDDPGLFEHRGIGATWRKDCTAMLMPDGKYKWGDNERQAFVTVHNTLVALFVEELTRLAPYYDRILAYVAPKLTHRSFISSKKEKEENGLRKSIRVGGHMEELVGINDIREGLVTLVPSAAQLKEIYAKTGRRVSMPLSLPESLELLTKI